MRLLLVLLVLTTTVASMPILPLFSTNPERLVGGTVPPVANTTLVAAQLGFPGTCAPPAYESNERRRTHTVAAISGVTGDFLMITNGHQGYYNPPANRVAGLSFASGYTTAYEAIPYSSEGPVSTNLFEGMLFTLPSQEVLYITAWRPKIFGSGSTPAQPIIARRYNSYTFGQTATASSLSGLGIATSVAAAAIDDTHVLVCGIQTINSPRTFFSAVFDATSGSAALVQVAGASGYDIANFDELVVPTTAIALRPKMAVLDCGLLAVNFFAFNDTLDNSMGVFAAFSRRASTSTFVFDDPVFVPVNTLVDGTQELEDVLVLPSGYMVVVYSSSVPFPPDISGTSLVVKVYTPQGDVHIEDTLLSPPRKAGQDQMFGDLALSPSPTGFHAVWVDYAISPHGVVLASYEFGHGSSIAGVPALLALGPLTTLYASSLTHLMQPSVATKLPGVAGSDDAYVVASAFHTVYNSYSFPDTVWYSCVCKRSVPITLDTSTCSSTLGATPFSLASCLGAAIASPLVNHGSHLVLPAGSWTDCPATGVSLTKGITLEGAGPGATVIDCQGTGRAFLVHGPSLVGAGGEYNPIVISSMTIVNGAAPAPGSDPQAAGNGGALALLDTHETNVKIYLQDLALGSCEALQGSGGAVFARNVNSLWVNSLLAYNCTAGVRGGGVAFEYPAGAVSTSGETERTGAVFSNMLLQSNTVRPDGPLPSDQGLRGGGGFAASFIPSDYDQFVMSNTTVSDNTVGSGSGGGLLFQSIGSELSLDWGVYVLNNAVTGQGASGGGLAVHDFAHDVSWSLGVCSNNRAGSAGDLDSYGGCLMATRSLVDLYTVHVSSTSVTGNSARTGGGGLALVDVGLSTDAATRIEANTASRGGGLALIPSSTFPLVTLTGTVVRANSATVSGGGVYFTGGTLTLAGAQVSLNSAAQFGGGLSVVSPRPPSSVVLLPTMLFGANTAGTAGPAIFECLGSSTCDAPSTTALGLDCSRVTTGSALDGSALPASPDGTFAPVLDATRPHVGPGPPLASDAVTLGHAVGVSVSPLASARMLFPGETYVREGVESTRPRADYSFVPYDVFGSVSLVADTLALRQAGGVAHPTNILDGLCTPSSGVCVMDSLRLFPITQDGLGSSVLGLTLYSTSALCVTAPAPDLAFTPCLDGQNPTEAASGFVCGALCGAGEYLAQATNVSIETCLPCPAGTFNPSTNHRQPACAKCPFGMYAYSGATACKACPAGGDCGDGTQVLAQPGYWYPEGQAQDALDIPGFIKCKPDLACPGGDVYSACSGAYHDGAFLCAKCARDHAWAGSTCTSCWPTWVLYAVSLLIVIAAALFVGRTVMALSSSSSGRAQVVKVAVSYLHVLTILVSLKAQRSRLISTLVGVPASFSSLSISFFSFACLHQYNFRTVFYMSLLLPLAAVGIGIVSTLLISSLPSLRSRMDASLPSRLILILLFLSYPAIAHQMMRVLHCRFVEQTGEERLVIDLDVKCWEGEHTAIATLAFGGIAAYVIGIPLGGLVYLGCYTRSSAFASRFAFFVEGYAPSLWWWEVVVMLRKSTAVTLLVFVQASLEQLYAVILLLLVATFLNAIVNPFVIGRLNTYEVLSLAVLLSTCFVILLMAEEADDAVHASWRSFAEWFAVALNAVFVSFMLVSVIHPPRSQRAVAPYDPDSDPDCDGDILIVDTPVAFGVVYKSDVGSDVSSGSGSSDSSAWATSS